MSPGLMVDDAYYILLSKALAKRKGLPNHQFSDHGVAAVVSSMLFSACFLSLVFRIAPDFPENVWLLKGISIAAMLGTRRADVCVVPATSDRAPNLAASAATSPHAHAGLRLLLATSSMMSSVLSCSTKLAAVDRD